MPGNEVETEPPGEARQSTQGGTTRGLAGRERRQDHRPAPSYTEREKAKGERPAATVADGRKARRLRLPRLVTQDTNRSPKA